ncbi:MAG: hypothetical protein II988_04840 [Clostridia bacterium]|nr:hypothetical protein [Clostridia bacterium]
MRENELQDLMPILLELQQLKQQEYDLTAEKEYWQEALDTKDEWRENVDYERWCWQEEAFESSKLKKALKEREEACEKVYDFEENYCTFKDELKKLPIPKLGIIRYIVFVLLMIFTVRFYQEANTDAINPEFFRTLAIIFTVITSLVFIFCLKNILGILRALGKQQQENERFELVKKENDIQIAKNSKQLEKLNNDYQQKREQVLIVFDEFIEEIKIKIKKINGDITKIRKQLVNEKFYTNGIKDYDLEDINNIIDVILHGRADTFKEAVNIALSERAEREHREEVLRIEQEKLSIEEDRQKQENEARERREKEQKRHNKEMERLAKINPARCMTCKKRNTCSKEYCYGYWHDFNAKI